MQYSAAAGSGSLSSNYYPFQSTTTVLPGLSTNAVAIPRGSDGSTNANAAYTTSGLMPYDAARDTAAIDPSKRRSLMWKSSYDFAPWAQLYFDARWSRFEDDYIGGPVTLNVRLPAGYPGNPFSTPVYLSKVFYDLPRPETKSAQTNSGLDFGLRGDVLGSWRYDVSASWARNQVSDDAIAMGFNFGLLSAAMASANKPLLAYDSLNGRDPNAAGVLAALTPFADHKDTTDTYQYIATADGTVWSGWAGDLKAAVGAEAGEEKVKFWREPSPATPTFVLTKPFSRTLTAAFAEATVPLLSEKQHLPLVHRLEAGGAVRATDYSDAGSVTTPTYRGLFQPVKWITLRASRANGFKPVRLYDLQAPVTNFTTTLSSTNNVRDPLRGDEAVLGTFSYKSGGNPTLKPESSVSKNAGIVIDLPGEWLRGLSLSVDYYQIDFSNRSGSTSLQTLLNYFPERIRRAAPSAADLAAGYAGLVTSWDASSINLSSVRTMGWDYRISYRRRFGIGEVSLSATQTDPNVTWTTSAPGAKPGSTYGHQPKRTSVSAFWTSGPWTSGVAVNHQARYFISGLTSLPYPSYIEWNPQLAYNFGANPRFGANAPEWWARWLAGARVSLTIINVFNREPTLSDAIGSRVIMDPRLRRYILSASKRF